MTTFSEIVKKSYLHYKRSYYFHFHQILCRLTEQTSLHLHDCFKLFKKSELSPALSADKTIQIWTQCTYLQTVEFVICDAECFRSQLGF